MCTVTSFSSIHYFFNKNIQKDLTKLSLKPNVLYSKIFITSTIKTQSTSDVCRGDKKENIIFESVPVYLPERFNATLSFVKYSPVGQLISAYRLQFG